MVPSLDTPSGPFMSLSWSEHNVTTVKSFYKWAVYQAGDPRVADWPLMDSPIYTIALTILYYIVILGGKRIMADRKPFDLKKIILAYNVAMVGLSGYMCIEIAYLVTKNQYNISCSPVDYSPTYYPTRMAAVLWWYYFSKLIEFFDTFAMMLRKKNNQITFLHLYHHGSMFMIWWMGVKWAAGGMSLFGPMMNSFVHVLMYGYYALSSLGVRVWWKKYLTIIQLIQFGIAIQQSAWALYIQCDFPRWMMWSLVFYAASLTVLFLNFYIHSYFKRPDAVNTAKLSQKSKSKKVQ